MRTLLVALLAALPAWALPGANPSVVDRRDLPLVHEGPAPSHALVLTLAYFKDGGWAAETIAAALGPAARILGQCGVAIERAELLAIEAPERFRYFHTPVSRELARALPLARPTVYFVAGTRQRPAFDAEAIGRGNSRSRPELAGTVWIAQGARDLEIVLAHELAHVLMDSGEHSDEPGNLLREETAPTNTRLTDEQCARLREAGAGAGLLAPAQGWRLRMR